MFNFHSFFQNVIVLDLSEQQCVAHSTSTSTPTTSTTSSMSNNVLSDILQMTGIMTEEEDAADQQETISEPQKCTTTLQKGIKFPPFDLI